jgi:hypothetical protein
MFWRPTLYARKLVIVSVAGAARVRAEGVPGSAIVRAIRNAARRPNRSTGGGGGKMKPS